MSLRIRGEGALFSADIEDSVDLKHFFNTVRAFFNSVIDSVVLKKKTFKIGATLMVTYVGEREVSEEEVCEVEHYQFVHVDPTETLDLETDIDIFYQQSIVNGLIRELDSNSEKVDNSREIYDLEIMVIDA